MPIIRKVTEIEKENLDQFLISHVSQENVHLKPGVLMPIGPYKMAKILKQLEKPSVLKKILNRKKIYVEDVKTGKIKRYTPSLKKSDILHTYPLSDNPYDVYYNTDQIVRFVNLYLTWELNKKANRSISSTVTRQSKLLSSGQYKLISSPADLLKIEKRNQEQKTSETDGLENI